MKKDHTLLRRSTLLQAALATAVLYSTASAATLYWDTNAETAGSGNADGDWDAGTNWSTSPDGDVAPTGWTDGEDAVFSAGTDGTAFTATVTGTVATPSITVEEAGNFVTLDGGTIEIGGGMIDTSALGEETDHNVTIASTLAGSGGLTIAAHGSLAPGGAGNSELDLTGANTFTGDLTITSGLVGWSGDEAFGDAANNIVLDGGGLVDTNRSLNIERDLEIGSSGGTIRSYGSAETFVFGAISGGGLLSKTDGGTLVLTSDDNPSFTGKVAIGGGPLQFPDTASLGPAPASPMADFFTLDAGGSISGGDDLGGLDLTIGANRGITINGGQSGFNTLETFTTTVEAPIVNGNVQIDDGEGGTVTQEGSLAQTGGGTTIINGGATHEGDTFIQGGTLDIRSEVPNTGEISLSGTSQLNIGTGATITAERLQTSDGSGAQSTVEHTDGVLNITGTNNTNSTNASFHLGHWGAGGTSSVYNLSGGELNSPGAHLSLGWDSESVSFNQTGGTANLLGIDLDNGRDNPATYNLDGGTLNLGANGITANTNKTVNLGGGTLGSLDSWSSGQNLILTGTSGDASLVPDAGHTISLSGELSGTAGLSLDGPGTLALSGASAYDGATAVNNGTLRLAGTATGLSPVTVAGGAHLEAGGPSSTVETLTLEDGSSSAIRVDFDNPSDFIVNAADGFSASGTHTIGYTVAGELLPGDIFPVFDYTGTIGGDGFNAFELAPLNNPHIDLQLVDNTDLGTVDLEVVEFEPIAWTGATDGVWDVDGTGNWELDVDASTTNFFNQDRVSFFDGAANTDIMVDGAVAQSTMEFLIDEDTYTFTGDGIGGAGGLLLDGTGTVRLFNDNTYSGATEVLAGKLVIGDGTNGSVSLESGISVEQDAELEVNIPDTETFSNNVELAGGLLRAIGDLTVDGSLTDSADVDLPGALEVTDPNSLSVIDNALVGSFLKTGDGLMTTDGVQGNVTVEGGTLAVTGVNGDGNYTVEAGADLELDFSETFSYNLGVTVQGTSVDSDTGLFLGDGANLNFQNGGGLEFTTAPGTIQVLEDGNATLSGFDINATHLTVQPEASGTVIPDNVTIDATSFGYRMNILAGDDTATGDLVVESGITGTGGGVTRAGFAAHLQKWGDGSVRVNGPSTFDKGIWIREGSVILGADNVLPTSVPVAMGDGDVSGTLALNGFNQTMTDLAHHNENTGSTVINGASMPGTLTLNYNGGGRTFSGTIGGEDADDANLGLTKTGNGTFTLAGTLAYTGDTSVEGGTLSLANAELDDSATVAISGSGTLDLAHGGTDTVGGLSLAGDSQPDGTYGATGSGAENIDDDHFSGSGVLLVGTPSGSPYDTFETANGITGDGPEADSDGDGIPNGIEFVLGTDSDPNSATNNSTGELPTAQVNESDLEFVFRRDDDAAGANPVVEYGSDLTGWTVAEDGTDGVTIAEEDDAIAAGIDRVTVTIPRSLASGSAIFARLRVDLP